MKFLILAMAFMPSFGLLGASRRRASAPAPPGDGPTMQFNDAANSQLLALLEDF